jgi:predicted transcriptional regulator
MITTVVVARPDDTVGALQERAANRRIHCFPIVNDADEPIGVLTTNDLADDIDPTLPLARIMNKKVYSVARYDDVYIAARVMRNHRIHHLIVTHEQKVVGILSSFDLLELVEDHRFTMKNPPPQTKRGGNDRR